MTNITPGQQTDSIVLNDDEAAVLRADIIAPIGEPAIDIVGDDAQLLVTPRGSVSAPDPGNTAVNVSGDDALILNRGEISGAFNAVSTTGNEFRLINSGTISSDSRALDLTDGDGIVIQNFGEILGTGDQRNGTVYGDGTADDIRIVNARSGIIDAGEGNLGDGISIQIGEGDDTISEDINIVNRGLIQGRGDGPEVFADGARVGANGSSGVRFVAGSDAPESQVTGSLTNSGTITAEVSVGFLGGVVVEDGVAFDGSIVNERSGVISGPQNALYVGNAEHDLEIVNQGTIESGSRAVNLDGDNVVLSNSGDILGTGDQRNGTVYADGTADNLRIVNTASGVIDAGEGNLGDGISIQIGEGDDTVSEDINIVNRGLIQGRGDGPEVFADGARVAANGSSGVRYVAGSSAPESQVTGSLINSGTISAEVSVGFLGGVVVEDGVAFDGRIVNQRSGLISGPQNGLYVGNAEHDLEILNLGDIESGSRAVNLDGDNVVLRNAGNILGTGDQRNGTVYADGTADNLQIVNAGSGIIDAGEGNLGDGISIQIGEGNDTVSEDINIVNRGLIQGRGDGPEVFADGARVAANGSSGVRYVAGSSAPESQVTGSLINSGTISAEVSVGFLGGVVVEDGVAFDGRIVNQRSGLISGPNNGLYLGNAEHDLEIVNQGTIESGSRAVNLDGDNVVLRNSGDILGTGDQRNGTIYVDGTGDDIRVVNTRSGTIDAGVGNSGSGVSVQVGANIDGEIDDETSATIVNVGTIQGRGDANVPSGVRLFVGAGLDEATFSGNIVNRSSGVIASETDAGILIEAGVVVDGRIINAGTIEGGNGLAINAEGALGEIDILNRGSLVGDVQLGEGNDSFRQLSAESVVVDGGVGDDTIRGGSANDLLTGGQHRDILTGGAGQDTFRFDLDSDVDIITDFSTSGEIDLLDFSDIFSDVSEILGSGAAIQVGNATRIEFGDDNAVVLRNTALNDLTSDNFIL